MKLIDKIRPYVGTHTARQISERIGHSRTSIYKCCSRNGVSLLKDARVTPDDLQIIDTLLMEGYTYAELADKWGMTYSQFAKSLKYCRDCVIPGRVRLSRKAMYGARIMRGCE